MNEFPIQESKVQRPPLREATLRRDRLLDWLNAKIHHRVVFVTAEAGYGKTTLLSDFARRTRLRTLWYRLDEEDRDWISLLNYLVAAGRQVEPSFAPGTAAMLRELGSGGPARDTIVDAFIHELSMFANAGAVLILDDYHLVDDVPDIRTVMREVVARAPERLTLVFISRRRPSIPLARIRALGELEELRAADLRFDERETDQLFRESFGTPLEPDVLADLTRRTEGWVASLQLVQAAIRDRSMGEIRAFVRGLSGAQSELYDYLAEEVVGELDADLRSFLMETSILQTVDAEIAAVAAGVDETTARELMVGAEQIGLLPPAANARREGQRYHPLVREFLEARLRREVNAAGVLALHRRVATYGEHRSWRLAAHHYGAAGDVLDLHRVIAGSARTILGSGEFALAESYLDRFPPSAPDPAFDMVRSRMDLDRDDTATALQRARAAVAAFPPDSTDPNADLALANLISVEYYAGNLEEALRLARHLITLRPDPHLSAIASATVAMLQASGDGNLRDYTTSLRAMAATQRDHGDTHYLGITQINLSAAERAQGLAIEALADSELAIEALGEGTSGHELPSARTARAWSLAHLGRWAEAMAELDRALAATHALARAEVLQEAADIHGWYGDGETAERLFDDAFGASTRVSDGLKVSSAQNLVRLRRFEDADQLIRTAALGALSSEVALKSRHLVVAALLAVGRHDDDAHGRAVAALSHANSQDARFWAGVAEVLLGVTGTPDELNETISSVGQRDPALLSVIAEPIASRLGELRASAYSIVTAEAARRAPRWRPALRVLLGTGYQRASAAAARLLDDIGSIEDVARLRAISRSLRGKDADPTLGRRLARRLAPPVFVEDQGRVTIRVGNDLIAGTEIRRKVLSLLCFLLTRPELSATRDQVLEALWPDMEPEVAGNSLNQTVYFLRRVFEPAYREDLSPGYLHHDSDVLWLDNELVASRSRMCRELIRASGTSATPADVQALSDAYQGRFALDFAYEEWAAPYRDSLHAAYLEVVERAIQLDTNTGHFERGITIARRAIDVDPEAEQLELALLRLYRLTGAHAAAAEQYGHYSTVLREELGLEAPPLETL